MLKQGCSGTQSKRSIEVWVMADIHIIGVCNSAGVDHSWSVWILHDKASQSNKSSRHLVLARTFRNLVVADLIHELESLKRLLHSDADVLLSQGYWAEGVVKEVQTLVRLHPAMEKRKKQQTMDEDRNMGKSSSLHVWPQGHAKNHQPCLRETLAER